MLPALVVCPVQQGMPQLGGEECLNPFSDEGGGGGGGGGVSWWKSGVNCSAISHAGLDRPFISQPYVYGSAVRGRELFLFLCSHCIFIAVLSTGCWPESS